jgi:hypothetical protein
MSLLGPMVFLSCFNNIFMMKLSMISSIYMFQDFFEGKLEIYGLNCGVLTSILNEDEDDTMNKFRIMSLLD